MGFANSSSDAPFTVHYRPNLWLVIHPLGWMCVLFLMGAVVSWMQIHSPDALWHPRARGSLFGCLFMASATFGLAVRQYQRMISDTPVMAISRRGILGFNGIVDDVFEWDDIARIEDFGTHLQVIHKPTKFFSQLYDAISLEKYGYALVVPVRHVDQSKGDILAAMHQFAPTPIKGLIDPVGGMTASP